MSRSTAEYDVDTLRLSVDRMENPSASPELRQSYEDWTATRRTTLTKSGPQSGMDVYMGLTR